MAIETGQGAGRDLARIEPAHVSDIGFQAGHGLVLEVAFEGLQRSIRHKSGLAMRFPRISSLRWDKPPGEADRLETLEGMLKRIEAARGERQRRLHAVGLEAARLQVPLAPAHKAPVVIDSPMPVKARVRLGTIWSALTEAEFQIQTNQPGFRPQ